MLCIYEKCFAGRPYGAARCFFVKISLGLFGIYKLKKITKSLKPFIKSGSIIGDCNHGNVVMKNYKAIKNMTVHTHAYAFLCRQSGGYVIAGPSLKEHGERKNSKGE